MDKIGLYFIINESYSQDGIITDVNNAIHAGVRIIQYNERKLRKRQVVENAYILSALCKKNRVLFIVNDYPDVAALVEADGVHLSEPGFSISHVRRMLGDDKLIGMTAHTLREAVHAEEAGVDYITYRVADTAAKKARNTIGKMKELITIPVIAVGDFSFNTINDLARAGVDGIAMMSHLYVDNQLQTNIRHALTLFRS